MFPVSYTHLDVYKRQHSMSAIQQIAMALAVAGIGAGPVSYTHLRSSLLYLNMLNEMRFMAVQVRALTNDERNFVACLLYTSQVHRRSSDDG